MDGLLAAAILGSSEPPFLLADCCLWQSLLESRPMTRPLRRRGVSHPRASMPTSSTTDCSPTPPRGRARRPTISSRNLPHRTMVTDVMRRQLESLVKLAPDRKFRGHEIVAIERAPGQSRFLASPSMTKMVMAQQCSFSRPLVKTPRGRSNWCADTFSCRTTRNR